MSCTHDLVFVACPRCKVPVATMPLPAEVVAVLEACEIELTPQERGDPEVRVGVLWDALDAWRAAGRPGLEKK